MLLSRWSVRRPIAMTAFIIVLIMLGINSYRKLSIDLMPSIDIPYIMIRTEYQGASPEEIEVEVARRIEDAVSSLDGLLHISSTCMENECRISLEFSMGTNVDIAATDVREQLNRIRDDFPDGVKEPMIRKIDNNATNVATILLVGDRTVDELYDYADYTLSNHFSSVPGVGQVRVHGANDMQMHIFIDRFKLASANLTIDDLRKKLIAENVKVPAGRIRGGDREVNLTFDGEFKSIEDIKALEVGTFQGKRVYLRDVAEVKLVSREMRSRSFYNDRPCASLGIIKKGDANAVKVISELKKRFNQLQKELPGGMKMIWFRDAGAYIDASVADSWGSIVIGIALTAALLFLFLHDLRSTFIVIVTMPISVVTTFLCMLYLDYTFNTMTLLSLGCSVGVLVTNSIIVIENIFNRLNKGDGAKDAAEKGSGEVFIAVAASALTNVVVFVPVAMMTSRTGRMMAPFAGVMVAATLVSLFISFTLTPILSFLFFGGSREPGKIGRFVERCFGPWNRGYSYVEQRFCASVVWVRKHALLMVLLLVTLGLAAWIFIVPQVGLSFFPNTDQGEVSVRLEFPTYYNLAATTRRTNEIAAKLREMPCVRSQAITIGNVSGAGGQVSDAVYLAQIMMSITQKNERRENISQVMKQIREQIGNFNDCLVTLSIPKVGGGGGGSYDIPMRISGAEIYELERLGQNSLEKIRTLNLSDDLDTSIRPGKPSIDIVPRRPVLRNLGITAESLSNSVRGTYEGLEVGTYRLGNRSFDIRIRQKEEKGLDQLEALAVGSNKGIPMNVGVLNELKPRTMTVCINRYDKERAIWLYANTAPGKALGDVADAFRETVQKLLPPGYGVRFTGQVERMGETSSEFVEVIALAILLTYLLIAAIMESWTRPFLIMFTVPLGFLGMYFTLWCFGMPMSMMGLLGGVMMIGIVVNNAILIMDGCGTLVDGGMAPHDAMERACREKFRPIVMTSIASVAGMIPMAFGSGLGSELRASCGVGVVGGLAIAALLTLYAIPALYFLFVPNRSKEMKEDGKDGR